MPIVPAGAAVYTADGALLGRAREHAPGYLHVRRSGRAGAVDYYVPAAAIARVDEAGGRVVLTPTRAEVDARDWSAPPALAATPAVPDDGAGAGDRLVVPVVEERLEVERRPVDLGEVVIQKRLFVERRLVPVELRREAVRILRPGAGPAEEPDDWASRRGEEVVREETTRVPLRGEEPVLGTRAVVTGEVVVTKELTTERRAVAGAVRREVVEVAGADGHAVGPAQAESPPPTPTPEAPAADPAAATTPLLGRVREGLDVICADDSLIGRVKEVRDRDFLVDRQLQRDIYVPFDAVRDVAADGVRLTVPADRVDRMGWANPPLF
jgi:stress response protein YsnF